MIPGALQAVIIDRQQQQQQQSNPKTNPNPNTNPIQLFYAFFEHRPMIFKLAVLNASNFTAGVHEFDEFEPHTGMQLLTVCWLWHGQTR